jgi:hypothetical protein
VRAFYNEASVEVEGEQLTLVLNFRAIDVIESLAKQPMSDILKQLGPSVPYSLVGKVLFGLLREMHDGVSLDQAAGVAFGPDGAKVGMAISDLLDRGFNFGEAKGKNPPKRRGRSQSSEKNG